MYGGCGQERYVWTPATRKGGVFVETGVTGIELPASVEDGVCG